METTEILLETESDESEGAVERILRNEIAQLNQQIERHSGVRTLDRMIDETEKKIGALDTEIQGLKEHVHELAYKKAEAVRNSLEGLSNRANLLLPKGRMVIDIREDGTVFLGWDNGKTTVPYEGLSGGQKVAYDMALSAAMLPVEASGKVLIVEAGELDTNNLILLLEKLAENCPDDTQIICNSCHMTDDIPNGWNVINVDTD